MRGGGWDGALGGLGDWEFRVGMTVLWFYDGVRMGVDGWSKIY